MKTDLFWDGSLVRLTSESGEMLGEKYTNWYVDSELCRLMGSDIFCPRSARYYKDLQDKLLKEPQDHAFFFNIKTLAEDRWIGDIELDGIGWSQGDTFVGISINDRDYWDKGYGADAMRLILRFAFIELNLRRVTLNVFEYNPRAISSYAKVGFKHEGRLRSYLKRDGRRWDVLYMGILKEEWEGMQ